MKKEKDSKKEHEFENHLDLVARIELSHSDVDCNYYTNDLMLFVDAHAFYKKLAYKKLVLSCLKVEKVHY